MSNSRKGKKHRTIKEMEEELKKPLKIRAGVMPTKIIPDKKKYSRKKKHRSKLHSSAD